MKSLGLSFLAPAGLALSALLVPLVVLYLLKVRRQRRAVASTWLWASAQRDLMARSPFKRLVPQVPLLLQALALAALALGLARPATRGRAIVGDHVAIVVDTSASMAALAVDGAPPGSPRRIDLAKQAAKDLLSSLTPGSDALVLEAGREAHLAAPLDRDVQRLKAVVDRMDARDVEGDLGAAVALAADRLRPLGGSRRVVVVTDGNLARPDSLRGVSLPLDVVTVGAPVDNAGIVRIDVRSGTDPVSHQEEVQAFLLVANYGKHPRDAYVTLREENASDVLASRRVLVPPGEKLPVVLTFHPTPGDYRKGLVAELSPHDALPVDDAAFGRVPAGDKLPVYLAAAEAAKASPWLQRALAADPMVELHVGSHAELAAAQVDLDALVVIEGACPAAPPGGDVLVVDPPAGTCYGAKVGDVLEHPSITSWEHGDPRLRFLTLDGVHIARAHRIQPEGRAQELIRTQEGAVAADVSSSSRTATLLGFDVGDSDWPLKASFVLFVRNLVEQARAHRAHGVTGPARTGEPLRVSLPSGARKAEVTGPGGAKLDASLRGTLAVVPELGRVGLYHVAWEGPGGPGKDAGSLVVPANLTSEAESDLRPKPLLTDKGAVDAAGAAASPDAHRDFTWVLALVALAFVLADVAWLTRKPRLAKPAAPAEVGPGGPVVPRAPQRRSA
jgi:hypothetical protein